MSIDWMAALPAAAIGAIGSMAYFSALYFGFIGSPELLARVWSPDSRTHVFIKLSRVMWFILVGASVAFIFQLPQSANPAPIQAFIVGTTWPTIVAQVLTARQSESPESIKEQIAKLLGPK